MLNIHNIKNPDLKNNFTVLKKCSETFDCKLYEMLYIRKNQPVLNVFFRNHNEHNSLLYCIIYIYLVSE